MQSTDALDYNTTKRQRTRRYRDVTCNIRTAVHKFKAYCDLFVAAHKLYTYPDCDLGGLGEAYSASYQTIRALMAPQLRMLVAYKV